jgi:hypothetical protein
LNEICRTAPAAITCGVYGWMVHTRYFASLDSAQAGAEEMKPGLVERVHRVLRDDFEGEPFKGTVERFPT